MSRQPKLNNIILAYPIFNAKKIHDAELAFIEVMQAYRQARIKQHLQHGGKIRIAISTDIVRIQHDAIGHEPIYYSTTYSY